VGALTIAVGSIVYVDANALIYAVERVEPYASLLRPVWDAAGSRTARLIASELLIIETLTGPLKHANKALVTAYEQILAASDLELLPVNAAILKQGASIRADFGLKTPDAIHAAAALRARCSMFLTNDQGFRRIPQLSPTILGDLLTPSFAPGFDYMDGGKR
jgi:predicted nucleic acid-binding protein